MYKSIAVATVLMAGSVGQTFAANQISTGGCHYTVECIIHGVAYPPTTSKGFTCNLGYAASVKVCAAPPRNARVSKQHPRPVHGVGSTHNPIVAKQPIIERHSGGGGGGRR
jgi:hypothetical protein